MWFRRYLCARTALDALFEYIRTHSYITEDDRPALEDVPKHTEDKDVSASTASSVLATPHPRGFQLVGGAGGILFPVVLLSVLVVSVVLLPDLHLLG